MIYFIIGILMSVTFHVDTYMDTKKYPYSWSDTIIITAIITIIWPYFIYLTIKDSFDKKNRGQISMRGLLFLLTIILGGIIGGGIIFYWIGNIIFKNWY